MKKFLLLLVFSISVFQVLAYTQSDIDNASFLATEGIIVKQSSTAWYRLDATITRAEVMGIALKMKWIVLPNYQCKGYYTDVRNNDWICRAVELAADNGIISRANTKARPQDSVTRAEAFSILFKVSGLTPTKEYGTFVSMDTDATQWQKDLFVKVRNSEIEIPGTQYISSNSPAVTYKFFPNRIATRAEIFSFANSIIKSQTTIQNKFYINDTYNYSFYYPSNFILESNNDDSPFTTSITEVNNVFLIEKNPTGTGGTSRSLGFNVIKVSPNIPFFEWYDLLENHYSYFSLCAEDKVKSFEWFVNLVWTTYWKIYFWDKGGCESPVERNLFWPAYYFKVSNRNDIIIELFQGQLTDEEFKIIFDSFKFQ